MGLLHGLLTQGPSMRFFFHALGDLNTWRGRTTGGSGSSASEPWKNGGSMGCNYDIR